MKLKEIIDRLCNHEISKQDAIEQITIITDRLRKGALEFTVDEVGSMVQSDEGYLKLILPYGYSKMKGLVKTGDKVDVTFLP